MGSTTSKFNELLEEHNSKNKYKLCSCGETLYKSHNEVFAHHAGPPFWKCLEKTTLQVYIKRHCEKCHKNCEYINYQLVGGHDVEYKNCTSYYDNTNPISSESQMIEMYKTDIKEKFEKYDKEHCCNCDFDVVQTSTRKLHCYKCCLTFPYEQQNHCGKCCVTYTTDHEHCHRCCAIYDKDHKHCYKCCATYQKSFNHCCKCNRNYETNLQHCCRCQTEWKGLHKCGEKNICYPIDHVNNK